MSTSIVKINENAHSSYCGVHEPHIDECSLEKTFCFDNLMDFDFNILHQLDCIMVDPAENVAAGHDETMTFSSGTNELSSAVELEKSHLKTILDEVMEESSLTDLLLTGAEAVEANDMDLASTVVARLNNLLSNSKLADNPLDRLALFFTQALHYKISVHAPDHLSIENASKPWETNYSSSIMSTTALQMLQELSPYVKFGHFTANHAILEATQGSREIHVIDFDVLEGIQWPPFMVDLAVRGNVSLRITAVVMLLNSEQQQKQNSQVNLQKTARWLQEFSESINLRFTFDQIIIGKEEDFSRIQVGPTSTLVANCMVQQLHHPTAESYRFSQLVKTFLRGVTKLSPKIIVLLEDELFNFSNKHPSITFVDFFCEAIHHYTALFDSLASGFSCTGGYNLALRIIEKEFLGTRILDSLRQFPCQYKERRASRRAVDDDDDDNDGDGDGFFSIFKGFRRMSMSSYNISQANFLVSLFGGGYWVQHEHCRLALCWKSRPLTTASIWVPISSQGKVLLP